MLPKFAWWPITETLDRLSKSQHNHEMKHCENLHLDGKGSSKEEDKAAHHPLSDWSLLWRRLLLGLAKTVPSWAENWVETAPWCLGGGQPATGALPLLQPPYFPSLTSPILPNLFNNSTSSMWHLHGQWTHVLDVVTYNCPRRFFDRRNNRQFKKSQTLLSWS